MNSPARALSRRSGVSPLQRQHPRTPTPDPRPLRFRRGLSLMELMIAATISVMIMGATVTLFGVVGDKINAGRAMIETGDHLRAAQSQLRHDLRGATVSFLPWEQPSAGSGYFEIYNGVIRDTTPASKGPLGTIGGYTQDVLMFTTRSRDVPFTGRFVPPGPPGGSPITIESQVAEVVWYMQPTFNPQGFTLIPPTYTLYRRQFLVYPSPTPLRLSTFAGYANQLQGFYDNYDISAHPDGSGNVIANSLSDLAYRENRFAHNDAAAGAAYPFRIQSLAGLPILYPDTSQNRKTVAGINFDSLTPFQPTYLPGGAPNIAGSQRYGEDVVLTNVLSFDVKVWDPGAPVLMDTAGRALVPSDAGYVAAYNGGTLNGDPAPASLFTPPQYGAYVDLYYGAALLNNNNKNNGKLPKDVTGAAFNTAPPSAYFPSSYFIGPYYGLGYKSKLISSSGAPTPGGGYYDSGSVGSLTGTVAVNGFDDSKNSDPADWHFVDNPNERLTTPPYPVPLRGIQVKIRVYEPSSRQVREVTTTETFMPD